MKTKLLVAALIFLCSIQAHSQQITFEDGTTVTVNHASFDYQNIRKASLGFIINIDGLAGSKFLTASYLQPEKFHIAANVGFASVSLESSIFFTGKTKERERGFAVKYESGGYRTIKKYMLNHPVNKRKELGLYLAVNDYGHLLPEAASNDASRVDHFTVMKQTKVYAGIAAVNYWHAHINVDDNYKKRGQYIGRTIFAPFITFGSEPDTVNYTIDDAPRYGARLMYELSNTFGLMGPKVRGRTNMVLRMGIDLAVDKNKNFYREVIFGFGVVYNFAETK